MYGGNQEEKEHLSGWLWSSGCVSRHSGCIYGFELWKYSSAIHNDCISISSMQQTVLSLQHCSQTSHQHSRPLLKFRFAWLVPEKSYIQFLSYLYFVYFLDWGRSFDSKSYSPLSEARTLFTSPPGHKKGLFQVPIIEKWSYKFPSLSQPSVFLPTFFINIELRLYTPKTTRSFIPHKRRNLHSPPSPTWRTRSTHQLPPRLKASLLCLPQSSADLHEYQARPPEHLRTRRTLLPSPSTHIANERLLQAPRRGSSKAAASNSSLQNGNTSTAVLQTKTSRSSTPSLPPELCMMIWKFSTARQTIRHPRT